MTPTPAPDWSAYMGPPLPVLLRAAADRIPDTATPLGVAACLVRMLREHADAIERDGRGWKTADLDDGT